MQESKLNKKPTSGESGEDIYLASIRLLAYMHHSPDFLTYIHFVSVFISFQSSFRFNYLFMFVCTQRGTARAKLPEAIGLHVTVCFIIPFAPTSIFLMSHLSVSTCTCVSICVASFFWRELYMYSAGRHPPHHHPTKLHGKNEVPEHADRFSPSSKLVFPRARLLDGNRAFITGRSMAFLSIRLVAFP